MIEASNRMKFLRAIVNKKMNNMSHQDTIIYSGLNMIQYRNYLIKFRVHKHRSKDFFNIPLYNPGKYMSKEEKYFVISRLNQSNRTKKAVEIRKEFQDKFGHKMMSRENMYKNFYNMNLRLNNLKKTLYVNIIVNDNVKKLLTLIN